MKPDGPTDAETKPQAIDGFKATQNLASLISKSKLTEHARTCLDGLSADRQSMEPWLKTAESAMEMAKMDGSRQLPFDRAADVRAPTLMVASMQFAARAYPTIMADDRPVKVKAFGQDQDQSKSQAADRVSAFMSWQLTEGMECWEEELDRKLHILPITGCVVKKVYFCPSRKQPISELVPMDCLILDAKAKSRHDLRVTQEMEFRPHEIEERVRRGLWLRPDRAEGEDDDSEKPQMFYEQHCRLDLDEDGYAEPYIVTIHKELEQIVRIQANYGPDDVELVGEDVAKIKSAANFVFFPFLPDPEFPVLGMGYGQLMLKLGASINSILNQLLDAGTLQNVSGGLINKSVKMSSGKKEVRLDAWQWADYDASEPPFVEFPKPQPSTVLFSLLGYLVDMTKEISSTTDAMTGEMSQNIQPTTLLALIEQGQKVYNAVYKRLFRSLKQEYQAIFRVNAQNIDPEVYLSFHDQQVGAEDFMLDDMDISPAADPSMASDMTEMARAGVLQQFMGDPLMNQIEIRSRILKAAKIEAEGLINPPQEGPDPAAAMELEKLQMESDKIAVSERKLDLDEARLEIEKLRAEREEVDAKFANLLKHSQAIAAIAQAEAAEEGQQLAQYQEQARAMQHDDKMMMEIDRDDHKRRMDGLQEQRALEDAKAKAAEASRGQPGQGGQSVAGIGPAGTGQPLGLGQGPV